MKLDSAVQLHATGTSEGAMKAWDTRGRGRHPRPRYDNLIEGPKGGPAPERVEPKVGQPLLREALIDEKVSRSLSKEDAEKYRAKLEEMKQHGWVSHQTVEDDQGRMFSKPVQRTYQPSQREAENFKKIGEADKVLLTTPIKGWNETSWNRKIFPVGFQAIVLKVVPRNGTVPAMALLKLGKTGSAEFTNLEDVQLIKKAKAPSIEQVAPKNSRVLTSYKTADGANAYVLKPSKSGYDDSETRGSWKPSSLKGQFKQVVNTGRVAVGNYPVPYGKDYKGSVYFAQSNEGKKLGDPDMGTAVFVYRHYDSATTTIHEVRTGQYGNSESMDVKTYRTPGKANQYLSNKFGIRDKLPIGYKPPAEWYKSARNRKV